MRALLYSIVMKRELSKKAKLSIFNPDLSPFSPLRFEKIQNIDPLLLRIETSQLRWFGHLSKMPQEKLLKQALLAKANGKKP